jgi:tetratricopeptide (TPR) repeat protein
VVARRNRLLPLQALMAIVLAGSSAALAEPVLDQALAGAQLVTENGCALLKVNFNFRIRYSSHFPLNRGDELRVSVRPIDPAQAAALVLLKREAARVPNGKSAAIKAIDFDVGEPTGPVLRIQFEHPVSYQVAPHPDFQSIVIAIAAKGPSLTCRPEFLVDADATAPREGRPAVPAAAPRSKSRPSGKLSEADLRVVASSMDEARAALKKKNFNGAIQLFTKVLKYPENEYSAEAQELLGLVRQKNGQLAEARSEYEDYLRRYPTGEGNERVRQRLAGIITASGDPDEKLRIAKEQRAEKRKNGNGSDGGTTWSFSGSFSQFYVRDDSFRQLKDPSLPPVPNEDVDAHRVHQNAVLSSFDLFGVATNDRMKSKFRFSGTHDHNFINDGTPDIVGISALYAETSLAELDLMGRVGRQTRNSGGVLGRFDGGLLSWQANPLTRLNVVTGSPVVSRRDPIFKDEKYFYGASVDIGPIWGGVELSLFAIEQRDRSLLDRRAVGAELRYFDPSKTALATIDYDLHFQQLNAAIFSGSWTFSDKSTLYGTADYRKAPYLSAWNALQGQPFTTLYDMLRSHTKEEIDQLAIDRTAAYTSAMVGFSRPLTQNLQVSMDATAVNVSGTIASGGVDATLPVGTEYFYSAQLIGTGIFKEGDMYIAGARFADLADSKLYVLDFNTRFPLLTDLRVSPRLRLGYRKGDTIDLKEYTVLPSILLDYYWTKDLALEFEVGSKWTSLERLGVKDVTTELFLTAGFRYDFYADDKTKFFTNGKSRCAAPWPICR